MKVRGIITIPTIIILIMLLYSCEPQVEEVEHPPVEQIDLEVTKTPPYYITEKDTFHFSFTYPEQLANLKIEVRGLNGSNNQEFDITESPNEFIIDPADYYSGEYSIVITLKDIYERESYTTYGHYIVNPEDDHFIFIPPTIKNWDNIWFLVTDTAGNHIDWGKGELHTLDRLYPHDQSVDYQGAYNLHFVYDNHPHEGEGIYIEKNLIVSIFDFMGKTFISKKAERPKEYVYSFPTYNFVNVPEYDRYFLYLPYLIQDGPGFNFEESFETFITSHCLGLYLWMQKGDQYKYIYIPYLAAVADQIDLSEMAEVEHFYDIELPGNNSFITVSSLLQGLRFWDEVELVKDYELSPYLPEYTLPVPGIFDSINYYETRIGYVNEPMQYTNVYIGDLPRRITPSQLSIELLKEDLTTEIEVSGGSFDYLQGEREIISGSKEIKWQFLSTNKQVGLPKFPEEWLEFIPELALINDSNFSNRSTSIELVNYSEYKNFLSLATSFDYEQFAPYNEKPHQITTSKFEKEHSLW